MPNAQTTAATAQSIDDNKLRATAVSVHVPCALHNPGFKRDQRKIQKGTRGDGKGPVPGRKLHQFLSDIGVKALRQHLGQLLGIAQVSKDKLEYEGHVRRIFGDQLEMDFGANEAAN